MPRVAFLPILATGAISLAFAAADPPAPAVPAPAAPRWSLAPSETAVFDATPITVKDGKEARGKTTVRTVHGHDLREGGQYRPVTPYRRDLPAILAFRLPAPSTGLGAGPDAPSPLTDEFRPALADVSGLVVKGTSSSQARDDGQVEVETTWTFGSRGDPDDADESWLREGKAKVTSVFDPARGAVASARVALSYRWIRFVYPKGEDPKKTVDETWEFVLKETRKPRYDGFQKEVDAAIERGIGWLRKEQKPDGSFPPWYDQVTGQTALALLTLAECGVAREDADLERGMSFLETKTPTRTYEQALSLMAIERAYTPIAEEALLRSGRISARVRNLPPARRAWCENVARALEAGVESPGSWGYPPGARALLRADSSNTQYGALGLRAARRMSIPVEETTWIGLVRHFLLLREKHAPKATVALVRENARLPLPGETTAGPSVTTVPEAAGFHYSTRHPKVYASMTCAGIASLELARSVLAESKSRKLTPAVADEIDRAILGGWAWLDRHWGVDRHPEEPGDDWWQYYLYSLERAGVFSRVRLVGGKDWYFEGAVELLLRQQKDGFWEPDGGDKVNATCFALLFLKRATAPLQTTGDDGR